MKSFLPAMNKSQNQKENQVVVDDLKPTPSIDYVAKLNQPITEMADSEKAWPIYRPMWTKYKAIGNIRNPKVVSVEKNVI